MGHKKATRACSGGFGGLPYRTLQRTLDQSRHHVPGIAPHAAVDLNVAGPPSRAAALTAAYSTWLAADSPVPAFGRAPPLHLSSAHKA
jgi:hypothetical protein